MYAIRSYYVEDNKGNLWISTNRGISRIDSSLTSIRNYAPHDGLQDLQFMDLSGCKRHDGELLFGGVNGFNAFYPDEIKEDTIAPLVVFNDMEVMNETVNINDEIAGDIILNKPINLTDTITLKYTQNNFRFYFAGIHHASPRGTRYKYMLEGFEKEWNNASTDERIARYTNIDPGEYIFKVKAANSDGYWSHTTKDITIIITPPIWLMTWFQVSVFLLFIISTGVIINYRFYSIKHKNILLEKEVQKRVKETFKMNEVLKQQAQSLKKSNLDLTEQKLHISELAEELRVQTEYLQESNLDLEEQKQQVTELVEELRSQNEELDIHKNQLES